MASSRVSNTLALSSGQLARGAGPGAFLRPAVARLDQAQVRQTEIGHHPGDRADVLGQLRLVQDHAGREVLGGHRHPLPPDGRAVQAPQWRFVRLATSGPELSRDRHVPIRRRPPPDSCPGWLRRTADAGPGGPAVRPPEADGGLPADRRSHRAGSPGRGRRGPRHRPDHLVQRRRAVPAAGRLHRAAGRGGDGRGRGRAAAAGRRAADRGRRPFPAARLDRRRLDVALRPTPSRTCWSGRSSRATTPPPTS